MKKSFDKIESVIADIRLAFTGAELSDQTLIAMANKELVPRGSPNDPEVNEG